jgi:outer membrane immunogenic protein
MNIRVLMLGVASSVVLASGAQAADLLLPAPAEVIVNDIAFGLEGPYVGLQGGATFDNGGAAGLIGVVAGVNFAASDAIFLGAEVELNANSPYFGSLAVDALVSGKIGAMVTDDVAVYAKGGIGALSTVIGGAGVYQIGAGVEFAVTDDVSLRGELMYYDDFSGVNLAAGGKATVGVLFHF